MSMDLVRDVVKDNMVRDVVKDFLTRDLVEDDLMGISKQQLAYLEANSNLIRDVVKDNMQTSECMCFANGEENEPLCEGHGFNVHKCLSMGNACHWGPEEDDTCAAEGKQAQVTVDAVRDVVKDYLTRDVVKDDMERDVVMDDLLKIGGMHQEGNGNLAVKNKMNVKIKRDLVRDVVKDYLTRDVVKDDFTRDVVKDDLKKPKVEVGVSVKVNKDDLIRDAVKDYLTRDVVKDDLLKIGGIHQEGDGNLAVKNKMNVKVKRDLVRDVVKDDFVRDVVKDDMVRDVVKDALFSIRGAFKGNNDEQAALNVQTDELFMADQFKN